MKLNHLICFLIFCFLSTQSQAQQTAVYTEANEAFKKGKEYYDNGLLGESQREFLKVIQMQNLANEPNSELIRKKAELYYAKSAVMLNSPEGEKLVLDFARKYDPDPLANQAIIEMANYYYNDKNYDKAADLYSNIDTYDLTKAQRAEVKFKLGYSLFFRKKFSQAGAQFNEIKDIDNVYYYPTNYYLGITQFYANRYDQAVKSFQRVTKSKKYAKYVPYYITQIYFAQGQFDNVIAYGAKKARDRNLRNLAEINQLVGQAYFENEDFASALPHLEYHSENSKKMRVEDFYQLGYTQYQTRNYAKAVKNFEQLNSVNSKIGQSAMYSLADCNIKLGKKQAARVGFKQASKMSYDPEIQKEAHYNYAKLSYELKYDREAVTALQLIPMDSKYYAEAQTMLSSLFLNTRDYENALKLLNSIPNKTPKMRETYQKVAYLRGLQIYRDGNPDGAKGYFKKSLEMPIDNHTKALSIYWLGEIAHNQGDYSGSIREMNKFITLAKTMNNLPDEASLHTANYTMGYNYLKQKNYSGALGFFQEAIAGIRQRSLFINNEYVSKDVLGDATLRAGDCLFKRNKYTKALRYYNEAVNNRYRGYVYALYQKAIIEGLRGNTTEKILALENITDNYSNSQYTDNALLQLAVTYQEIGKFDLAKRPLDQLIADYDNSELYNQALIKLGLITYNQGNLQSAISYYKQVFSHNPTSKEAEAALTALEEIYVDDLGQTDEYFAFLETIPGYKVGNDQKEAISFKAGESQFENGNYEKAIENFTNFLRKYPNGSYALLAHYHRGESYSVLKKYSEALIDYDYIVQRGQSKYYAKSLRKAALIAYNYEQDFNKAFSYYSLLETAAGDDDTRFEAQLGAMRSAYRTNDSSAVFSMAEKVSQNPRASDDQKASAYFYLGKIYSDQKDYDKALTALNQVTKLSDNEQTAEARYMIAYIYYLQRDLEIAQQLSLNANKESAGYNYWIAKSVILLADILAEKGDLFNAQAALEGLIENYDEDQELVSIAKAKLQQLKLRAQAGNRLIDESDDSFELDEDEQ
jgi:tetratricopeptide (TPR) repeat protein